MFLKAENNESKPLQKKTPSNSICYFDSNMESSLRQKAEKHIYK